MQDHQKRSSIGGMEVCPVRGGGSADDRHSPSNGGGYQNIFRHLVFDVGGDEQILAELREMGLPRVWMEIAEQIGALAFLTVWRMLSADEAVQDEHYVYVPQFSGYLRYQRNRFILALAAEGIRPEEIRRRVRHELCEEISRAHILRIIRNNRTVLGSQHG